MNTLELLESERNTAFNHSYWSRYQWLQLLGYSQLLQVIHEKSYRELGYSPIQDSFYALENEEPNESPAGQVWAKIMEDKKFPDLVKMIVDKPSRVNVMKFLHRKFYEVLEELNQEQKEQEEEPNPQPEETPFFSDDFSEQKEEEKEEEDEKEQEKEERQQSISQMREVLTDSGSEDGEGNIQPDPQAGPQGVEITPEQVQAVSVSTSEDEIEDLKEEIKGEQTLQELVAGTGMSPQEEREFIEYAYNKFSLQNMSKLLGWAEGIVGAAVRENQGAVGDFSEIHQKSWNSRVTPMDQMLVSSEHPLGMAKFAQDRLNTRIHREEKPTGKGSVVFLHDESSSMRDDGTSTYILSLHPDSRTPEQQKILEENPNKDLQAINLQLALARLFRKEGRPFTAIAWDSYRTRTYKYGTPGLEDHLKAFFNGGTKVTHALNKALDVSQKDAQHKNNADIVVATDGDTSDDPEYDHELQDRLSEYRKRGGRVWGIFIGYEGHFPRIRERMLTYCDFVVNVQDLFESRNLQDILRRASVDNTKHKKKMI